MQCIQGTVTNGISLKSLNAVENEGEEVKLFVTPHQTDFLIHGDPRTYWCSGCQCAMNPSCCPQLSSREQYLKHSLGEMCCIFLSSFLYS